jgi:dipeptidyl aminopeptidase/acylaminoacyl peptidase
MPSQSRRFADALRAADMDTQLVLVPDVGHGLIGKDAATTSQALRQALAQTIGFLDQRLKQGPGP